MATYKGKALKISVRINYLHMKINKFIRFNNNN